MIDKNKIIINFCPTGMVPTKKDTPHVPISAQEIIEQTHEAYEIGITIAHLHARDDDGVPAYKKVKYAEIFEGVRKYCPTLVVCGSTSGRDFPEFEKRSEVTELQPDMCSLTLSSLNFINKATTNESNMIIRLAEKMKLMGVQPELECFDLGMINYGKYLISKGIIEPTCYWNLLFGNIAGMQANLNQVSAAVHEIPATDFVALAGLGKEQLPINSLAVSMGLGVRVGLEDAIWWDEKKTKKSTNTALVRRIHELIEINQKTFFTPKEFGARGFYNRLSR